MERSVRHTIEKQVAEDIRNLALPRIASNVSVAAVPFDQIDIRPGAYITPERRIKKTPTNERNTYGYPFLVSVIRGAGAVGSDDTSVYEKWLQDIMRTYDNKRFSLTTCPTNVSLISCTADEEEVHDERLHKKGWNGSFVKVTVWVREPRTT